MPTFPYRLILEQSEVQVILEHMARSLNETECQVQDCLNCLNHRQLWWDLFNELDGYHSIALHGHLIEWGIPLPAHPTLGV